MTDPGDSEVGLPWYGLDWGAPICRPESKVETPWGDKCGGCGGSITSGSNGIVPERRGWRAYATLARSLLPA